MAIIVRQQKQKRNNNDICVVVVVTVRVKFTNFIRFDMNNGASIEKHTQHSRTGTQT